MTRHSEFPMPGLMEPTPAALRRIPIIQLSDHPRHDRWDGIPSIGPILVNELAPEAAVAQVWMFFRHLAEGRHPLLFSSGETSNYPINIVDPATWLFAILPQDVPFLPGAYQGILRAKDVEEKVFTLYDLRLNII